MATMMTLKSTPMIATVATDGCAAASNVTNACLGNV